VEMAFKMLMSEALKEYNPMMTFPIKKRINADMFIDALAAL